MLKPMLSFNTKVIQGVPAQSHWILMSRGDSMFATFDNIPSILAISLTNKRWESSLFKNHPLYSNPVVNFALYRKVMILSLWQIAVKNQWFKSALRILRLTRLINAVSDGSFCSSLTDICLPRCAGTFLSCLMIPLQKRFSLTPI